MACHCHKQYFTNKGFVTTTSAKFASVAFHETRPLSNQIDSSHNTQSYCVHGDGALSHCRIGKRCYKSKAKRLKKVSKDCFFLSLHYTKQVILYWKRDKSRLDLKPGQYEKRCFLPLCSKQPNTQCNILQYIFCKHWLHRETYFTT